MDFPEWYLVIGALLVLVVLVEPRVRRMPLTTTMVYLGLGWVFAAWGWLDLRPLRNPELWERLSEVAVIVSLFSAGLKLRVPLSSSLWRLPVVLAFGSMALTVGLIVIAAKGMFGLSLGLAVILGAVLAPTDPVLASDVQVAHPHDTDRLRFTLTGEAGLNDGTAFPFLMLGLGLLGQHDLGVYGWRWFSIDVAWAVLGGIGIGAILGIAVGRLVIFLRLIHREAAGLDDFLALGLIAFAYGTAITAHAYGFLAVFAAGLALRTVERRLSPDDAPEDVKAMAKSEEEVKDHPEQMPAYMAEAVLRFNEQLEHIGELALVLIVGVMVYAQGIPLKAVGFAAVLFGIIRPVAVAPIAYVAGMNQAQVALTSWFGVRGIGSLYYLFYALNNGVSEDSAELLIQVALSVIALSIVVHGISVTPLMNCYQALVDSKSSSRSASSPD